MRDVVLRPDHYWWQPWWPGPRCLGDGTRIGEVIKMAGLGTPLYCCTLPCGAPGARAPPRVTLPAPRPSRRGSPEGVSGEREGRAPARLGTVVLPVGRLLPHRRFRPYFAMEIVGQVPTVYFRDGNRNFLGSSRERESIRNFSSRGRGSRSPLWELG